METETEKDKRKNLKINADLHQLVKIMATIQGKSVTEFVEEVLKKAVTWQENTDETNQGSKQEPL